METYLIIDILLLMSCIFELASPKAKKCIIFLWMIFFTLFGGLRWETGGDWPLYKSYFDAAQWDFETIFAYKRWAGDISIEPGYMLLSSIVKTFHDEYWVFNLVTGAFAQYTYYRFSMEFSPKHPILMYVLILGMGTGSYMFVRSGLSVVICYWAYQYIRDRNFPRFLMVIILASFVHKQVLLFLPLYWAVHLRIKWQIYVLGYSLCCLFYMVFQEYITMLIFSVGDVGEVSEKLQAYTSEDTGKFGMQVSYVKWAMFYLMLCFFLYYRKKFNLENDSWYNCMLLGFFVVIASNTIFTEGMSTLGRISTPYKPARSILTMIVVSSLLRSKNNTNKFIAIAFFLGLSIINIQKDVTNPLMDICLSPYRSIFDFHVLK